MVCTPPEEEADLALLLKMYHCLERRRAGCGWELVEAVPARRVVISFPRQNLTGRRREILEDHAPKLTARLSERGWSFRRVDLETEALLIVGKDGAPP